MLLMAIMHLIYELQMAFHEDGSECCNNLKHDI